MDSRHKQRRKRTLFRQQDGKCHWCGTPMLLCFDHLKKPPPHLATFEHLDDRWSAERGQHPGERRVVLACSQCNNTRSTQNQAGKPKGLMRLLSGRHGSDA